MGAPLHRDSAGERLSMKSACTPTAKGAKIPSQGARNRTNAEIEERQISSGCGQSKFLNNHAGSLRWDARGVFEKARCRFARREHMNLKIPPHTGGASGVHSVKFHRIPKVFHVHGIHDPMCDIETLQVACMEIGRRAT